MSLRMKQKKILKELQIGSNSSKTKSNENVRKIDKGNEINLSEEESKEKND